MPNHATRKPLARIAAAIAAALLVSAAACPAEKDPIDPVDSTQPRPTSLSIISGNSQQDTVGRLLAEDLVVELKDQFDNTMSGQTVGFTATLGDGTVGNASVNTDVNGRAATTFTLGTETGNQQVVAAVSGSPAAAATFTARAVNDVADTVRISSGDGQRSVAGLPVSIRPSVVVEDQYGNGIPGLEVTFAITGGAASITDSVATTGFNGVAAVGSWTIDVGSNSLSATVTAAGIGGNPIAFGATGVTSEFNIEVRYSDSSLVPTTAQRAAFDGAAARWAELIVGDLSDQLIPWSTGVCGGVWFPDMNETVDDLLIWVSVDSIDGPFGILGQAGPCGIRDDNDLPAMGGMRLDFADLATLESRGELETVILHEMGHVLGYGTLWSYGSFDLLQSPSDTAPGALVDTYFSGSAAIAAFDSLGGSTYNLGQKVPVENDNTQYGLGSLNGHWRESVFATELMTPSLNSGVVNQLSAVSVASLEDMGYQVVFGSSDTYALPAPPAAMAASTGHIAMIDDIWLGPIYRVDGNGRITGVVKKR
jgi:hypothetical protein